MTSIDPQVCSQNLDERLPGWTETDIYVALTRIWLDLVEEGLAAGPDGAASTLLADPEAAGPAPRAPRRRLPRTRRPWGVRLNALANISAGQLEWLRLRL